MIDQSIVHSQVALQNFVEASIFIYFTVKIRELFDCLFAMYILYYSSLGLFVACETCLDLVSLFLKERQVQCHSRAMMYLECRRYFRLL